MKWIGQNIYDYISRFRDDVYLENLKTTTQTSVLVVDANGKISKSTSLADDIIESEIDTLAGLTAIGTAGNTVTTTSFSVLDVNRPAAEAAEDNIALHVDFDRIIPSAGTDAHNDIGIDLDVNSSSLGTSSLTGMDISVVGAPVGTSTAYGLIVDVNSADTNYGTIIRTSGTHLKLFTGLTNVDDYATFTLADTGDLTIATVGDGSIDSDLTLDADGQIKLEPAAGKNILLDGTIAVDAGVVTGATSITSTAFVGDLTGTVATAIQGSITTLAGLSGIGATGVTTAISSDDVAMYNAVNNGNPTLSIGSSASNRFEIKSTYNSGTQLLCDVDFTTYTSSTSGNDGRFNWYVDEVQMASLNDNDLVVYGGILAFDDGGAIISANSTASSATQGGKLTLRCDDGAAMGDDHRLGVIEFEGAEDASATRAIGARIQAMCDALWADDENGTRLEFYTMDGDASSELSLTLDSNLLATFAGAVTVTGALRADSIDIDDGGADIDGTLEANTITIGGTNIMTGSLLTTAGTISAGVWNGTKITDVYTNSSGKRYGSTIKILPSDFMINNDAAVPLSFKDDSNSGVHINDTDNEAIAFVTIPEGMKATLVDVYGTHNKVLKVWEVDVHESFDFTSTTAGTGAVNTQLDITDVDATATNYLAIQVTLTNAAHRIWGGVVTIAPQ